MSITQEEMKSTPTAEIKTDEIGFVNPFDPKFEMSLEDAAKVYAQNDSEGDKGPTGLAEPDMVPANDSIPTLSEQQDELIREYLVAVIASRVSPIHRTIIDAAGYIINDDSIKHEDAIKVFKTLTKYFQDKYVRQ